MSEEIITGVVQGLAFGGQGIIRHEGMVVFVPFTSPKEQVSFRIVQRKKNYAIGELVEVLTPSPERISPRCPYFGVCGGCQLQHLNHEAQLAYKRRTVEDALKRIGKLPIDTVPPVIPASQNWEYRRHVTLTLLPEQDHFTMGYMGIDNKTVIPVTRCPIFSETILSQVQKLLNLLHYQEGNAGRMLVMKAEDSTFILAFHFEHLPDNISSACQTALKEIATLKGVVVKSKSKKLYFGETTATCDVSGIKVTYSPLSFMQNHPEQSASLYKFVLDIALQSNSKRILDLYCGIGILSLLLAKHEMQVFGVESNATAIQLAKDNAAQNHISNIQFLKANVESVLKQLLEKHKPDLVILNPPRGGLEAKVIQTVLQNPPKELIYISCMPPTLARDLQLLCKDQYHIQSCQAFDMFPQTAHVETVVHLNIAS